MSAFLFGRKIQPPRLAPSGSGRSRRRRDGVALAPRLEAMEERVVPTVNYYGGNLLPHVQAQALYLGSEFSSGTTNAETTTLNSYLSALVTGPYLQALTTAGYNVGTGTAKAGGIDKTSIASGSIITDSFIRSRLQADIAGGLLQAANSETLYVVYVEPNVAVNLGGGQGTTQQGILGYHTAFLATNGQPIRYAVVVTPGGAAHNSTLPEASTSLDQLTAVTSHEVAEAVTDPDVNSNVNHGTLGWYDPQLGEIGDIEESNPAAFVRFEGYLVQEVAGQNDQLLSIFTGPPSNLIATSTRLSGVVDPSSPYAAPSVTFTSVITPASGAAIPTGTIEVIVNGSVLGTAVVQDVNGKAEVSFTVYFYSTGVFNFTVDYLGSSQFQGSVSNTVTVDVF